ncbi:MAG: hypothetical protein LBM68_02535 [Bacteroidales bacterium]|nr:hypothetical protein [Bacteroidales bacterium]
MRNYEKIIKKSKKHNERAY